MSYTEYFDMFFECQQRECSYRAYTFDIVNSRNQKQYIEDSNRYYQFVAYVYFLLENEEQKTGKQILLKDKFNRKFINNEPKFNGNNYNPITVGDMVTYFVYNGSITTERMLQLFAEGLREFDINYPFHFKTGMYETNNYLEGGNKLYKGYMPQILESLSKQNGIIINKNYSLEEELCK